MSTVPDPVVSLSFKVTIVVADPVFLHWTPVT